MKTENELNRKKVFHRDYNLDQVDNLEELPAEKAVFGLFGIVDEKPINCRFIGESENLKESIQGLFEKPPTEGMTKFMQGPWVQMLMYETMVEATQEERQEVVDEWVNQYQPKIDEQGEYPGYYDR